MKKILVLAALTVAAAPAMASKARLTALGNSTQLVDTQTIFQNTSDIHLLGDFATLEFGSTGGAGATRAEGGFLKTMSFGKVGAYLGHRDSSFAQFIGTTTLTTEQSPLDLFFGSELGGLKYAVNLHYSSGKTEVPTPNEKSQATLLSLGLRGDGWRSYLAFGLGAKGETTTGTVVNKSDSLIRAGGQYAMGSWNYALNVEMNNSKDAADAKTERTNYDIGAVNSMAIDGGTAFYGIKYASTQTKTTASTDQTSKLPVVVGVEGDAASWLTLRASVTQSILLNETKTGAGGIKTNNLNDTVVAAGLGLKFNKLTLDAMLSGASAAPTTAGAINGTDLLANASVTYMF